MPSSFLRPTPLHGGVGPAAIVPVGMTLISSVALEPEVGAELRKGDELGYFQFGGSDIVMLFPGNVVLEARLERSICRGQRIGRVSTRHRPDREEDTPRCAGHARNKTF